MGVLKFIDKKKSSQILDCYFDHDTSFDFQSTERCAIVGNSGKLLDSEHGVEIDNRGCIVRFNAAPVDEYKKYVGSRTDFRVLNGPIMVGGSVDYVETPYDWISKLSRERLILLPHRRKRKEKNFQKARELAGAENELIRTDISLDNDVRNISRNYGVLKPSTGLKIICLFLGLMKRVDLYGFGFHLEKDLSRRHYWENFKFNATGGHKWKNERRFVSKLASDYNLNIY